MCIFPFDISSGRTYKPNEFKYQYVYEHEHEHVSYDSSSKYVCDFNKIEYLFQSFPFNYRYLFLTMQF